MRLTFRPLKSFLGFLDIKTGVTIAILFALLNKITGVYGLIAAFTGGSLAQLSMYIYSTLLLVVFAAGLRAVSEEDPKRTLYFAHAFFFDHILSTAWTIYFAIIWWVYTPHDGRRVTNSAAQKEISQAGPNGGNVTDAQREHAAMELWQKEKGLATAVLIIGWLVKGYFAILVYSYAEHLRKGSYRSLPTSRHSRMQQNGSLPFGDDDAYDDDMLPLSAYRAPPRTPGSVGSFAEFIHMPQSSSSSRRTKGGVGPSRLPNGSSRKPPDTIHDEVLFDSDEMAGGPLHSKDTTNTSVSTDDGR